jgi:hypothetical protein
MPGQKDRPQRWNGKPERVTERKAIEPLQKDFGE